MNGGERDGDGGGRRSARWEQPFGRVARNGYLTRCIMFTIFG